MTTRFVRRTGSGSPELDSATLAALHSALIEQRRFRSEQLTELNLVAPAKPVSGALTEVSEALRVGATSALAEVDAALARIADGSYGRCQHCARSIALARLEIVPMAALCMSCQRDSESAR